MPHKPTPRLDDPEQSKRFEDMAREVGADGDEETFERLFRKVVDLDPGTAPKPQKRIKNPT